MTIDAKDLATAKAANRFLFIVGGFLIFAIYQGTLPGSDGGGVLVYGVGGGVLGLAAYQILQIVPERFRTMAIVGGIALAFLWYMATQHNYNDCIISGMKDAHNERAAGLVAIACQKKFGRQ